MHLFVTAARGTELALKDELRELGFRAAKADRGGVRVPAFEDTAHFDALRIALQSRIGLRVLVWVGESPARDEASLYEGLRAMEWERFLDARGTLSVRASLRHSALTNANYVALKAKDAIVDRIRVKHGDRPNVDREDADLQVFVLVDKDRATAFAEASGGSLHERGYRMEHREAPLKESLAAAILRMSGWDRARPLVDPLCGAGTIALEADLWARRVAPGLDRARFGVERWRTWQASDAARASELRGSLRTSELAEGPEVWGSDLDGRAIRVAEANRARARSRARFRVANVGDLNDSTPPGWVVANLPYGERLATHAGFYDALADGVRFAPSMRFGLLLGEPPPEGVLPPPDYIVALWNGPIECRFATFGPRSR